MAVLEQGKQSADKELTVAEEFAAKMQEEIKVCDSAAEQLQKDHKE